MIRWFTKMNINDSEADDIATIKSWFEIWFKLFKHDSTLKSMRVLSHL